jgi:hypothetical protein
LQITEAYLVAKEASVTAGINKSICMQTKTIFPGHKLTVILQTVKIKFKDFEYVSEI